MKNCFGFLVLMVLIFTSILKSQEKEKPFEEAIEDNSFFVEEAYNQEVRVVQHIINCYSYSKPQSDMLFTFTQEWPAFGIAHQLSYTIPYSFLNSNENNGIGDILLNYRYQLFYPDESWASVSPRLSLILPTGNSDKGFGNGVLGFQVNIPASKRLSNSFTAHFNAGLTVLPGVKGSDIFSKEVKKTLSSYFVGGSLIFLAHRRVNLMLEYLMNDFAGIDYRGEITRSTETILCPGIRFSIEVGSLEIVPGLAVPMSFTKDENKTGAFFYLSFEHPY
jgi:hypothetical protein